MRRGVWWDSLRSSQPTLLDRMIGLVEKYRDRPMDLADASLVVLAHTSDVRHIVSIDSDFDIYPSI